VRYRVAHNTHYRYASDATLCYNQAYLLLRDTPTQRVLASDLRVEPATDDRTERLDVYGNRVCFFTIEGPHRELGVTATGEVELVVPYATEAAGRPWEDARQAGDLPVADAAFALESPLVPLLGELAPYAAPSFAPGRPLLDTVTDLNARIHHDFTYAPGSTTVATPLAEVLANRRGVCQDFAHVALGCLRTMGLPARYVSGYLETLPPPGRPRVVGADASHAWCAVRAPDGSWIDLDPTNRLVLPSQHITLAWGRDYADVIPLKGVMQWAGGNTSLTVQVDVASVPG
jgi:transglutaminase-like putative cysteine protease